MRHISIPLTITIFVACSSENETHESLGRVRSAVQGGVADTTHTFAVGVVRDTQTSTNYCSGTLIAPNLVLTARHCIAPNTPIVNGICNSTFGATEPLTGLFVTTDAIAGTGSPHKYTVTSIDVPAANGFCASDIALLFLASKVPSNEATPVTPLVNGSMTDHTKVGTKIAGIGYGVTVAGTDTGIGTRRIRENIALLCVPGDAVVGCPYVLNPASIDSAVNFLAGDGLCQGDSGSGGFDQPSLTAGSPLVIGVNSSSAQNGTTCGLSSYVRTDAHAALIIEAAKKAATQGGYTAPAWALPPPSPGSDAGAPDGGSSDAGSSSGSSSSGSSSSGSSSGGSSSGGGSSGSPGTSSCGASSSGTSSGAPTANGASPSSDESSTAGDADGCIAGGNGSRGLGAFALLAFVAATRLRRRRG